LCSTTPKRSVGQLGLEALRDQGGGVVAHPARGLVDAAGGFLAHGLAAVEHAIDGGLAYSGRLGHVLDGGSACHDLDNFDVMTSEMVTILMVFEEMSSTVLAICRLW
jgi:hypothetical protein